MILPKGLVDFLRYFQLSITLTILTSECSGTPLYSTRRLFKRSLATSREQVRRLQLQAMLKALEPESDLDALARAVAKDQSIAMKRAAEDSGTGSSNDYERDLRDKDSSESNAKLPWDIINRNVPLGAASNLNQIQKRGTPCSRRRRDLDSQFPDKRSLHGPPGEGWVPSYQMYDELCEDSQPVEVVKIQKLIVQDGVIRDNYIVEKAMIQ